MPAGASAKREREYEELKSKFHKSGRYKGREEEVAARIVNKQRAQYGETRREKAKDRKGQSPDRNLPIANYQNKTIPQIAKDLDGLSKRDLSRLLRYEESHKKRKGMVDKIHRAIDAN